MSGPLTLDKLVQTYIELREKKAQLKAEYEEKVSPIDDLQDKIEALLLQKFGEMGVESVRTPSGTAYASVRTSVSVADWDAYREFLDAQDNPYDYLDRRPAKAAIESYKQEKNDLPPGVNWSETRVINFRRT